MNATGPVATPKPPATTNGSGAAAILSAGIGCFALSVLAVAADKSAALNSILTFYKPTGTLSGVTTTSILLWLLAWAIFEWRWTNKSVAFARINLIAFALLGLSFLLTFPPIADLF
jgi:hypothetical protein